MLQRVRTAGGTVDSADVDDSERPTAIVRDPDGNTIELVQ
ncbi:MAG: hypothetical protein KatS3mg057_1896 [Herpetosiphonaceae bacterium]|nr:MAG: hypothetical protein KatS3mg057_1896 [Herpetosiphonaceae bacterium]